MGLLCALLPTLAVGIILLFSTDNAVHYDEQVAKATTNAAVRQMEQGLQSQALRVQSRLHSIGYGVQLLAAYSERVLSNPTAYAPHATAAAAAPGAKADPAQPQRLDNPVYYTRSPGGALRKPVDDGRTALFFRARPAGIDFSDYDHQRLAATAVLEPILKTQAQLDKLCGQSYLITKDSLLRTYPYQNLSGWPDNWDLSKLTMYAWSRDKADADGLVWSKPYVSKITGKWVLACLAPVMIGGKQAGVVGCEIPLSELAPELLAFPGGSGDTLWLARRDGIVLAGSDDVPTKAGVIPVAVHAASTAEKQPAKVFDEADITKSKQQDLTTALGQLKPDAEAASALLGAKEDGRFVVVAAVPGPDLVLGAIIRNRAIAATNSYTADLRAGFQRRLVVILLCLVLGMALAFALAWYEARHVVQPLSILTQKCRAAARSRTAGSVAIADEGEMGALAAAVQELMDQASAAFTRAQESQEQQTAGVQAVSPGNAVPGAEDAAPAPEGHHPTRPSLRKPAETLPLESLLDQDQPEPPPA